jgi:DNA-binding transcriptional MerR regulator
MIDNTNENLLNIRSAAKHLGIHTTTLRKWEAQGKIMPVRIGTRGDRRYTIKQLNELLNG